MPLSTSEKSALQAAVQTMADAVSALVVDPNPNPLQVQLDAANALIATLKASAQARKDADAAKVDGQDDLDAIAAAGH